jgi:hypothetical protein
VYETEGKPVSQATVKRIAKAAVRVEFTFAVLGYRRHSTLHGAVSVAA